MNHKPNQQTEKGTKTNPTPHATTTIFANASGLGGAITIIRVSGTNVSGLSKILPNYSKLQHRMATVMDIIDPSTTQKIDSALITMFKAPNSFTGEDVVEISCHGSPYVNSKVRWLLQNVCGFQMAEGGEFSKRAFLNGKMDLIQAEGINALIKAQTKIDHQIASEMMYGANSKLYKSWREKILSILTQLDASIDFEDEGIEDAKKEWIEENLNSLVNEIKNHVESSQMYKKVSQGVSIGIFGQPNVGKSSLLNALIGEEVAIVTSIAGTTRDIISQKIEIGGVMASIFDTAGIRETKDQVEAEGVNRALNKNKIVDIPIIVIDASKTPLEIESQINYAIKHLLQNGQQQIQRIFVLNKTDLITVNNNNTHQTNAPTIAAKAALQKQTAEELAKKGLKAKVMLVSTKTHEGLKDLAKAIEEEIKEGFVNGIDSAALSDRNIALLKGCLEITQKLATMLTLNHSVEIIASQLHAVASALSSVVGELGAEDVLTSIFSTFCIGK